MHADRGMVSFHRVLELIAGFDLQRLANLPWNCCLSFLGDRGMGHESLLTSYLVLTSLLCLTWPLVGKSPSAVGSFPHSPSWFHFNSSTLNSSTLLCVLCASS